MIETTAKQTVCIDYMKDFVTARTVHRPLFPLIEDNGRAFSNLAYRHIKDKSNPHLDTIDIYKVEHGFAIRVSSCYFSGFDEMLDRPYGWKERDRQTFRDILNVLNGTPLHDLCTNGQMRATSGLVLLYSLAGEHGKAETLRAMREERLRIQEARKQERIAAEKKRLAEEKAREENRKRELTEDAERKIRGADAKETMSPEQLLLLAEKIGLTVHPKTIHNLKNNVVYIRADGSSLRFHKDARTQRKPNCDGIFKLFHLARKSLNA